MTDSLEACEVPGRGYRLFLPPVAKRDSYQEGAATHGNWSHVHEILLQLTAPGDTVLDLGANLGTVTVPLARAGRRLVAYELLPQNARAIALAADDNGLTEAIEVRNGAVWDEPGQAYYGGDSAWAQVLPSGEPIHRIVIDDDCDRARPVKAIKIDVEGSELRALRGMQQLLLAQHPNIVFEGNAFSLSLQETSIVEVVGFVINLGYRVFRIEQNNVLVEWGSDIQPGVCVDYLATTLSDKDLSSATGREIRRLTDEEYAEILISEEKYSDVHRSYIAAIADLLPRELRKNGKCADVIASAVSQVGASPHTKSCRAGYGALRPGTLMAALRRWGVVA